MHKLQKPCSLSCDSHNAGLSEHYCKYSTVTNMSNWLYLGKLVVVVIEIGCVVTSLVVGRCWLVVTRVHCGHTVHPRPIVTMEH